MHHSIVINDECVRKNNLTRFDININSTIININHMLKLIGLCAFGHNRINNKYIKSINLMLLIIQQ